MVGTIEEVVENASRKRRSGVRPWHFRRRSAAARSSRPTVARQRDRSTRSRFPAPTGYFGVLPGHTPLLATLQVRRAVVPPGPGEALSRRSRSASPKCCPIAVTILAQIAETRRGDRHRARRSARSSAPRSGSREPHDRDMDFERGASRSRMLQVADPACRSPARGRRIRVRRSFWPTCARSRSPLSRPDLRAWSPAS